MKWATWQHFVIGRVVQKRDRRQAQQQPRQVLDALRSKARDLQRQRKRCADQEHLQKFRKQAVDGVMMSVELHLDEVWEQSMSSWYDAALRPPLLYAPKGSLGSPMSTAVQEVVTSQIREMLSHTVSRVTLRTTARCLVPL